MFVPQPPSSIPPQSLGQIRKTLKSLEEGQARDLQNYADLKKIEQQNTAIRNAIGDILKLTSKPIQTRSGKCAYAIELSNKFSGPIPEARYLIDLAQDAQHSP